MTNLNTTHCMRKIATLTVFAMPMWVLVLVGCSTIVGADFVQRYNQNPLTVGIPPGLSPQDVEEAMVLTLSSRGWTVAQRSPQEVVGQLDHRNFQGKITLKANGLIKILSESYFKHESGSLEPGVPKGWLRNIRKDLAARLASKAEQR